MIIVICCVLQVTGASRQRLSALYKEHGDPGDVAQECRSNQKLLRPPSALTVPSVFQTFKTIAQQVNCSTLTHEGGVGGMPKNDTTLFDLRRVHGESAEKDSMHQKLFQPPSASIMQFVFLYSIP